MVRGGALVARVVGRAAEPLLQLGDPEVGDRPVAGVIFAVHDERLQHRLLIGRVREVAQVLRRSAIGRQRILHVDQHALNRALARGNGRVGLRHRRDVGVVAEPGVVARDEDAGVAQVQVFLERVGAGIGCRLISRTGFLAIQTGKAAVAKMTSGTAPSTVAEGRSRLHRHRKR